MAYCAEYSVKPDDSSTTCPSQPCLTLSEYLQNATTYFTSGSTFTLLQGQHLLNQTMAINGVTGIILRGTGTDEALIYIDQGGKIAIQKNTQFQMASLEIQYAGRDKMSHTAITIDKSELQAFNIQFTGNAGNGVYSQGISLIQSTASFVNCSFRNWHSFDGGAIYMDASNASFSDYTEFFRNTAEGSGGCVYVRNNSNIVFNGINSFLENKSGFVSGGAVIYTYRSKITFQGRSVLRQRNSTCSVFVNQSTLQVLGKAIFNESFVSICGYWSVVMLDGELTFTDRTSMTLNHCRFTSSGKQTTFLSIDNSHGSILGAYNSAINFNAEVKFVNTSSTFLINASNSSLIFSERAIFHNNTQLTFSERANFGQMLGSTIEADDSSTVIFKAETFFMNNSGNGVCKLDRSHIHFEGKTMFVNNSAQSDGGAISLEHSTLQCSGNITFAKNTALGKGGAISSRNSIINFTENSSFIENTAVDGGGIAFEMIYPFTTDLVLHSPVTMTFDSNRAMKKGGALFYDVVRYLQTPCRVGFGCFYVVETEAFWAEKVQLIFRHNYANQSGTVLYGGSLGSCQPSINGKYSRRSGLKVLYNLSKIYEGQAGSSVKYSSDSGGVKFCNCNARNLSCYSYQRKSIYAQRGKNFTISVVATDLSGLAPVASTITAYIEGGNAYELIPQSLKTKDECTNITFQLFSEDETNTLVLHPADGQCSNFQTKTTVVLISCPPGFTLKDTYCTCDTMLVKLSSIIKCFNVNSMLQRLGNSWFLPLWNDGTTLTGFIYHHDCPAGYCKPESEKIGFTLLNYTNNLLCSSNRIGLLCGACKEGFGLTLNSLNCKVCTNNYISLLLFFGFSGIALIAMLLALHMTVAAGTINGLILYANIVNVNSITFYSPTHTNILTVFISWLNLDFGFETCFYDGLDIYSYAWLQYAFPFYLWFLIGLIILISKLSAKVGKLFGSNPVAVLATVMLMSYTKLLQATILTLSATDLQFSDGSSRRVWLYNANITYFTGRHISISIMAICVIAFLLVPYFFLMLLGYRLQAFSGKRAFRWFNKFTPLLDAYYAPYCPKMRFWPGLMLLVRGSLYMVTALSNSSLINLIAISSVFIGVLSVSWLGHRVYQKLYNEILEASFILNICLLSVGTFYVRSADGNQETVIYLSISIALLQFLGITCFHLFLRSKNMKFAVSLMSRSRYCVSKVTLKQSSSADKTEDKETEKKVSETVVELREPLLNSGTN